MLKNTFLLLFTSLLLVLGCSQKANVVQQKSVSIEPRRAEVLFLGHTSKHHDSNKYAPWMAIKLFKSGINMTYTTSLDDLNEGNLAKYDGLIIYANHEVLPKPQEDALKSFVAAGKGLIPLHSASGCFRNSDWYINTIGGQFASHKTGTFKNTIVKADHPVMKGISDFETFDETYVHQRINPDITILGERVDGSHREPYTWIRTEGNARIFYTAYGHEDKTWTNIGFLDLVRNGVLWALGETVQKQIAALGIPDVDIYQADTIAGFTQRHVVPKMQPALPAKESQKLIQVPVDFELKLFAAEPDIINPIAMAWDERGRLWIVESVDYPNTFKETDGAANDRIKICEDTNGDGVADKFTVFADKLNIPTSMVFANGGVVVSMAPDFVFLKDTDGDDVADVREVIMTGWNKFDTHAGPSNLQYGFDNKIWGVTGYSGFNGMVNGKHMVFPQGVYHLSPDGSNFEFLATTSNNTWGLGFSEDNNVFISTANNTHSAFYSIPGKYTQRFLSAGGVQSVQKIDGHYDAHAMTPNLRQVDVVGGFTAASGHHLYTARNYPKEYWNRIAFISEPTLRLVHNAVIEKEGAGFVEKDAWNLAASSDEWFGPVQATVGPDGAVWVADWYNFIIQHNVFVPRQSPSEFILPFIEQPHGQGNAFQSNLRDTNHGRIYRVIYKNAKKEVPLKLSKKDLPGLVNALRNTNMFWRMTAQRLLVEAQNKTVISQILPIITENHVDEIGLNAPAIHALWTLHGLGVINESNAEVLKVVQNALSHPTPGVRKAAVQVLPRNETTWALIQSKGILQDSDLNTRLAAFITLAEYDANDSIGLAAYKATQDEKNKTDQWMNKVLVAVASKHEDGFLKAIKSNGGNAFTEEITKQLGTEQYNLGRRNVITFSPDVTGKEIVITSTLSKTDDGKLSGFVVGQGNKQEGYAVYIQNDRLVFSVAQHGMETKLTTTQALPTKFTFTAALLRNGAMSLRINEQEVATGKAHMLFSNPLSSALRSGEDLDNQEKLGVYDGKFALVGNVQDTKIVLQKPSETNVVAKAATNTTTSGGGVHINLSVVPDMMQYTEKLIKVKAGQKISITFSNPDGMQHNLLIIKPGSLQRVGKAADDMLRDPKAADKQYVPVSNDILHSTRMLSTGESVTLEFVVPEKPGDYPYVCTFPGHWRGMNGILRVEK